MGHYPPRRRGKRAVGHVDEGSRRAASPRLSVSMSLFDYPRINITGTLDFSPATANNDDYSNATTPPLALFDSANVTAITGGMDDATFRQWVQEQHSFVTSTNPPATSEIIPAEWNYYGDLGTTVSGAPVVGVV